MIFFPASDRPCRRRGRQIGGERPTVKQARGLEGARDASLNSAVGGKPIQPTTLQSDDAAIGSIGAAQQPKKGRLTGAIGTDHAIKLALVDGKIDGVDGADAAERFARRLRPRETRSSSRRLHRDPAHEGIDGAHEAAGDQDDHEDEDQAGDKQADAGGQIQ